MPAKTGFADGADFVDVFHAEVNASWSDGLRKTVVCIIIMMREDLFPAFDQAWRYRLRADVHESPLIQFILRELDFPAVDGIQDVLRPRNQKPYDGAAFL